MTTKKKEEWTREIPTESGMYWFYGNPFKGQRDSDYRIEVPTDFKDMYLMDVVCNKHNTILYTNGVNVPSMVFDKTKRRNGVLGYFTKAILPEPPDDVDDIFQV